jgi:hypothetical protein
MHRYLQITWNVPFLFLDQPSPVRLDRTPGGGGRWALKLEHGGGVGWEGKPKELGENTAEVPLFPQQISREVTQIETKALRWEAWTMAQPQYTLLAFGKNHWHMTMLLKCAPLNTLSERVL